MRRVHCAAMGDEPEANWLRKATRLHRDGKFEEAIEAYRRALAEKDEPAAAILLANLLLSAPAPSAIQAAARRIQAAALAESAIKAVDSLPLPKQQAALYARHGYFQLQLAGAFGNAGAGDDGDDDDHTSSATGAASAASGACGKRARGSADRDTASIEAAVRSLERASALDPTVTIAWRNLAIAYRSLGRERDAEVALRRAIESCGRPPADLLYRHYKALKALGEVDGAALRLLDTLAADPHHMLASFWVRVMVADAAAAARAGAAAAAADGKPRLSAGALEKLQAHLAVKSISGAAAAAGAGEGSSTDVPDAALAVPHEYIKRLFDGYAPKFEDHLTQHLGYKTPKVLLDLALEACVSAGAGGGAAKETAGSGKRTPRWQRCADLGCGTGLAGIEFRPHVGYLAGVDLSGGMVEEARKRAGLYDELAVASVEGWLEEQLAHMRSADPASSPSSTSGLGFDCVVAADVFVYIGSLEAIFIATAALMAPSALAHSAGTSSALPLFIFSTEADLLAESDAAAAADERDPPGFRLTGTGRCVHARGYVLNLAEKYGFVSVSVTRRAIRHNAGKPVMGDLFVLQKVADK